MCLRILSVCCLLLVIVAAGCGSSPSSTTPAPAPAIEAQPLEATQMQQKMQPRARP